MSTITAAITAVGAYVPDFVLSNKVLETMVDTNDEWITTRTGIKERRILKDADKGTSFLAIKAAQDLIAKANIDPLEIDMVIMATATARYAGGLNRSLCCNRNWSYKCFCIRFAGSMFKFLIRNVNCCSLYSVRTLQKSIY